jgi:hypothetical protein
VYVPPDVEFPVRGFALVSVYFVDSLEGQQQALLLLVPDQSVHYFSQMIVRKNSRPNKSYFYFLPLRHW